MKLGEKLQKIKTYRKLSSTANEQTPPHVENKSSSRSNGSVSVRTQAKWGIRGDQGIQVGLQSPPLAKHRHHWGQKGELVFQAPTLPRGMGWEDTAVTVASSHHIGRCCCDIYIFQGTPDTQRHLALCWLWTVCVVDLVCGTESFSEWERLGYYLAYPAK